MRTSSTLRAAAGILAGLALIAGCTSDDDGAAPPTTHGFDPPDRVEPGEAPDLEHLVFAASLRQVGDCDALLAHLKGEALARVGPYGLGDSSFYAVGGDFVMPSAGGRAAVDAAESSAPSPATTVPASGDGSYSTTNAQEAGVDEPDVVKTDGDRIVTVTNGVLSVVDPTTGVRTGSLRLDSDNGYSTDMLLVGDKAIVFGSAWLDESTSDDGGDAARIGVWAPGRQLSTITEVDLSNASAPAVRAQLRVDGWYVTSRLTDGTVRVVLRSEPTQLAFVYPRTEAGEERAEQVNREVIQESRLEDWLPSYELRDGDGNETSHGLLVDCERVDAPTEFAGFGTLSVLTFDAGSDLGDGDAVSVLAAGDTVYASTDRLYVATNSYIDPIVFRTDPGAATGPWSRDYSTSIHAFSIEGDGAAEYLASGTVPGYLVDQFAMSEHDGRLRAASTKGVPWNSDEESVSMLTVLEQRGDELVPVGQVGDMGRGERIYSVRYDGDVAYVVTFRQTDPFYTVDLSDPTAPRVVGELKLPGFSSYLHPIGDGLVIGVGQDATDSGRVQGTKVSLFDVTDLAAPTEVATWSLPDSNSAAEWDHRAFLYWPATKQLVLPVNLWSLRGDGTGFFGAVVLTVDRSGIAEVGRVEHEPFTPSDEEWCGKPVEPLEGDAVPPAPDCLPVPQPDMIQRSLVVGDDLWTLGQRTLQANTLADLARGAVIDVG
jgi:uncharacterized secreted protein with C-terminal beta-propeller domain